MTIIKGASIQEQSPGVWHPYFLKIRVDDTPDNHVYEKRESLYFSEVDGWVSFHSYRGPGTGFGGAVFRTPVRQADGSVVIEDHKGPWSSNCSHASKLFRPCLYVHVHTDKYWNLSGHVTTELAKKILQDYDIPYKVCAYHYGTKGNSALDGYQIFPKHLQEGETYSWNHIVGKEC